MGKHQFNLLVIFCLILTLAGALIVGRYYLSGSQKPEVQTKSFPKVFADVNPGPKTTVLAPNGKMTLIFKEEKNKDSVTDTFSVRDEKTGALIQIYSEVLYEGMEISVPYNTFSPDNKYIFLKKITPTSISYFVLKTDGTTFANSEKAIDFLSLFNQKYADTHNVTDVTGWGGENLIVVNTDQPDGDISHSFWYDVTSNSFIQLSTRFN